MFDQDIADRDQEQEIETPAETWYAGRPFAYADSDTRRAMTGRMLRAMEETNTTEEEDARAAEATALADTLLRIEPGDSVPVRCIETGKTFAIYVRHDRWGMARWYGIIPEGRKRPMRGHTFAMSRDDLTNWCLALETRQEEATPCKAYSC